MSEPRLSEKDVAEIRARLNRLDSLLPCSPKHQCDDPLGASPTFGVMFDCEAAQDIAAHSLADIPKLLADRDAHLADLEEARRLLWLYHGHLGLYGDDGEMQCQGTDFKRDPLSKLEDHLHPEGAQLRDALERLSAAYATQVRMCLCGHPKASHTLGVLCEDCECPDGYEPKRTHRSRRLLEKTHPGSCDFPNCDHEGEVLSCDDCGGEFCWKHGEQEHHNCKALAEEWG